ncbi:hypothetical protein F4818DRAFT_441128 [Hypoxylon cercidicola]|nr:hypothetical protein F4818DRAFT_441128 [Hypoxylon cercidicola]
MALADPPAKVAIIGGGLAGLTLALVLHGLNITSTFYEARSEDVGQRGGVYERVRDTSLQFDVLTFKDGQGQTTDEYYFVSEKLYGYQAIRIMRKELLNEMKAMHAARTPHPNLLQQQAVVGADGIHSTVHGTFLSQVKPMYAGFVGINSVVEKAQFRIPDGYKLPATGMPKLGAFLLVPRKPDGSELFIESQRRFAELDPAGWGALRKGKHKLHDMLQENKADWPDIVQSALKAAPVDRMGLLGILRHPAPGIVVIGI